MNINELIENLVNKKEEARFDQVNVRIPIELNDWINERMRYTKRQHGTKILKEEIITAAILLLYSRDINWDNVMDLGSLWKELSRWTQ